MDRSFRSRAWISAGTILALVFFALAAAWHHHALAVPDDRALDRPEHASVSGPCHVCKLSTAGVTVPSPEVAASSAAPAGGLVTARSSAATTAGFDPSSPARAPPASTNA